MKPVVLYIYDLRPKFRALLARGSFQDELGYIVGRLPKGLFKQAGPEVIKLFSGSTQQVT